MKRPSVKDSRTNRDLYWVSLVLALITAAAYSRVLGCRFITMYDDGNYVLKNAVVQKGLTLESIRWAFSSTYAYNWHPLTWISHMLDCQIYGLNPLGHHLTSLLFHIASTLLLFLVLTRTTKSVWPSAFVAALFAVHPLHVESVAWVAERKDVLSTFFWILTMWAYVRYTECPSAKRYALVGLSFAFGLMAKPMLVTLPIILLLMDYWPLGRLHGADTKSKKKQPWRGWALIGEKTPLMALTVGSSAVTYYAQQHGGAVQSWEKFPFGVRLANALVTYVSYIGKMLWPAKLAVLYPHRGTSLPIIEVISAAAFLAGMTALVVLFGRRRPYLAVGWLWYLVTLVPVIGLVQVGVQAMANRYTYVPLIGLFIMVAWGVPELLDSMKTRVHVESTPGARNPIPAVLAGVLTTALAVCTWVQIGHWHDSLALFDYAVRSTSGNTTAIGNLGWAYSEKGDWKAAAKYFGEALKLKPDLYDMHYGLGLTYSVAGNYDAAAKEFTESLRLKPGLAPAQHELDKALSRAGESASSGSSGADYQQAMDHYNQAATATQQGNADMATREYKEAIRLRPSFAEAYCNLGVIFKNHGDYASAAQYYSRALKFKPGLVEAHNNLAVVYFMQAKYPEAWREVHLAERYGYVPDPGFLDALAQKMSDPIGGRP